MNLDLDPREPVAFFTGAGVSTGAGLPTYRGTGGIYTTGVSSPLSARHATDDQVHLVWAHMQRILGSELHPAPAHVAISQFAASRPGAVTVVTQNIDGLHERSARMHSSKETIHALHGTAASASCLDWACGFRGDPAGLGRDDAGVPRCPNCDGPTRPDVVLFGEMLDSDVFDAAAQAVHSSAAVIVVGTSLEVTPAANIVWSGASAGVPLHWVNVQEPPLPLMDYAEVHRHLGAADQVLPRLLQI